MIYAGILAGGTGTRMGIQDMPKQFLTLGQKPIIMHTVEKFLFVPEIDIVYVAVHPNWMTYFEDLLHRIKILKKKNPHTTSLLYSLVNTAWIIPPLLYGYSFVL